MKGNIRFLLKLIIINITTIILMFSVYDYYKQHYGYRYISLVDEIGISKKCYVSHKGLFCKTKDGLIEVRQYEKR